MLPTPQTGEPRAASETFDLVVVGAGAGGMVAALVGALEGMHVLLCESSQQVGGTTATSAGTLWVPGNRQGTDASHGDSVHEAARYLDALIGPDDAGGLRQAFFDSAAQAIDYLEQRTQVRFASAGKHPDYLQLPGAALSGRAISPLAFDGRVLGAEFHRIRPPLPDFMVLGGMMVNKSDVRALVRRYRSWPDFVHSVKLVARHAADRMRYPRGTRLVMGNALVARLFHSLRSAGVDLRFGWKLAELDMKDGRAVGARFAVAGVSRTVSGRAGVVLATGGVGHSEALRRELGPAGLAFRSLAADSVAGEGLLAARRAGAVLEQHRENFFWQPVSQVPRAGGSPGLFPHLFLDRAKPGLIAVNGRGERFVNEASSYHHFVEGMLRSKGVESGDSHWLLCDAAFVRHYGLGVIPPGTRRLGTWEERGYLVTAPTLEVLAQRLGIDGASLGATVARSNAFARSGHDPEFAKGSTEFDRFNGDPATPGNPCLGSIETPPFCALAIWPAEAASSGGLATNRDGRVMSAAGSPIPGLYACGNDAASIMRGSYPGPGTTLGPTFAAGYRIGLHARHALAGAPRPSPLSSANELDHDTDLIEHRQPVAPAGNAL
ncbi:FAD-binding protein [Hydrogenophaga sp.]|uniref:FAD-binding protein n=1 Tax=Hydrogenophaga sp. TaxID=1904254 RepID=UPI0027186914|nr:FAD-binding protein [Hydrogenophaga sp.]MDO9504289.1 FAD-dependent oxidoreductase [Hydrogenophaga sp.]